MFRRIDDIRDDKSEMNESPWLLDPTFGIRAEATPTWDLKIRDLSRCFSSACQGAMGDFPCSFDESRIRTVCAINVLCNK